MNKITRQNYPVSKLPQDLREGLDAAATVTVIVEAEDKSRPSREVLRALLEAARSDTPGVTTEEAVARIRTLRDEWED